MQDEVKSVPVPEALAQLIRSNNTLLQQYQRELSMAVQVSNVQMMQLLGLSPENGWKLDAENMMYVREETTKITPLTLNTSNGQSGQSDIKPIDLGKRTVKGFTE